MHFLITAGGTREYIDAVRFISNASSGRMSYALAEAARSKGHKVTLISASYMQPAIGIDFVGVETAEQMFEAVKEFFEECDCLIMAAAVSDYTPAAPRKTKIKRSQKQLIIKLKPTRDILKWAGKHKVKNKKVKGKSRIVVGFALEDKNLRRNAERKLKEKNLDMIIANEPAAIGSEKSTVHIKTADSDWTKIEEAAKDMIAENIISSIEAIAKAQSEPQRG